MIAVFAAMQPEVSACLTWTSNIRQIEVQGFPVYETEGAVICRTGIGTRAREASEAALARYNPAVALSVGVAGGLSPKLSAGDLVVCERVDHESHRHSSVEATVVSHVGLMDAASAAARGMGLPVSTGSSITVDELLLGADEKSAHHGWKGHDIVEMESFWIGAAAAKRGLPFLAVRTISDDAAEPLVMTGAMKPDGNFDHQALLDYVRDHPEVAPLAARQFEAGRLALGNLTIFLAAFLAPLVEHFHSGVR
jgi:adenosylhomocysteine nucleosidase